MNPGRITWLAPILGLSLGISMVLAGDAAALELFAIGDATSRADGKPAYQEVHCDNKPENRRMVYYRGPNGELIAQKTIDFSSGRTTPSFEQNNIAQQRTVGIDFIDGRLTSRRQNSAVIEVDELDFDPDAPLVIDAGFDEFIRLYWKELGEASVQRFQFPLATESSLVDLRIKPARCSTGDTAERCFALEPANWLVRLVAGSVELGYHPDSRRLTRFSGRSNLPDRYGKGFDVDILYRYDVDDAAACG